MEKNCQQLRDGRGLPPAQIQEINPKIWQICLSQTSEGHYLSPLSLRDARRLVKVKPCYAKRKVESGACAVEVEIRRDITDVTPVSLVWTSDVPLNASIALNVDAF